MALQDAASGGNNLAGGKRDEAQPQPDRDGQGDLGRCCGALCGGAWIGTWLVESLGKPSGCADLIQPGLVLLLCSAWVFPLLQPFPRIWGWRWVITAWTPLPFIPAFCENVGMQMRSSWVGHIPSIPALYGNSVMEMTPHRMDTFLHLNPPQGSSDGNGILMGWAPLLHPNLSQEPGDGNGMLVGWTHAFHPSPSGKFSDGNGAS